MLTITRRSDLLLVRLDMGLVSQTGSLPSDHNQARKNVYMNLSH